MYIKIVYLIFFLYVLIIYCNGYVCNKFKYFFDFNRLIYGFLNGKG